VAASDAPSRELGRIDAPMSNLTPWLADPVEFVPDLQFPLSVQTYAKMRRDPTIRSVLNAYVLPMLRAPWHVDPRGASGAITQLVADSLGLPVLGQDTDKAGPVATRWVRWIDHLRVAVRDLTFGFLPFEPVYEVLDGRAYVSALPERMPWSITSVDVDAHGNLQAIKQMGVNGAADVTIPADRLLYYVHEREGANWAGTSLLREAFGPWLFKTDAIRGQATTLRRFGSGVPVAEPVPGFNPTPAQLAEAQRMVSSIRVGDKAGAVTPGFRLRIVGIEGTLPDHLPFVRYLDEQMARSTLTSVLDLGSTDNGSRALGTVFLDLLVQALQAVAEEHAVTASQLARRLTDFNEGEAAEAPLIVVGDVGSSRQAVATTVGQLITAGAIVPDPALESWVREAFDLPASTGQPIATAQPAPFSPAPGVVAAGQGKGPALSRLHRGRRRRGVAAANRFVAVATQEGWPYRRQLTAVEATAGVDPLDLDAALELLVAEFVAAWPDLIVEQHDAILQAVREAVDAGDLTQLAGLLPPYTDVEAALQTAIVDAWDAGAATAVSEAGKQGVQVDTQPPDTAALHPMASVAAGSMAMSLSAGAIREAMRLAGPSTSSDDVVAGVASYLKGLSTSFARDVAGGVFGDGINAGRGAVMDTAPPARYFASEVRDANTCGPCADIDGTEFASLDDAEAAYPTGGYLDCEGGLRCRGIIFARYDDGGEG
jgi:hypothetical protein